jgi:hypothetical protein
MTRTMHVAVNGATVSTAKAITAAARSGPLVVLTDRAFRELMAELGGHDQAARHLMRVAANVGKPIGVNFDAGDGASSTVFMAPRSWTTKRLKGWVAGHHAALAAMFGETTVRDL